MNSTLNFLFIILLGVANQPPNYGQELIDTNGCQSFLDHDCRLAAENNFLHMDVRAIPDMLLKCSKCALELNKSLLAISYIDMASEKGLSNAQAIDIIKVRAYAQLKNDSLALSHLSHITSQSAVVHLFRKPECLSLAGRNSTAFSIMLASQPSLDIFTFCMSLVCSIGFFIAILFIIKGKNLPQIKWLALFIANFCIIMTSFILYWTRFNIDYNFLDEWWQPLYLLIGPFFYLYVQSLFGQINKTSHIFWHFIPFLITWIYCILSGQFSFFQNIISPNLLVSQVMLGMPVKLISLAYYFYISVKITKGDWMVDNLISRWTKYLLIFFGIFILANLIYYLCTFLDAFNKEWDYAISAVMAIGILGIASMGFLESKYIAFGNSGINLTPKDTQIHVKSASKQKSGQYPGQRNAIAKKYVTSPLTSSASMSIKGKLEKLMSEQKLFLRDDLRIQVVADILEIHKNHLSQVINENYGMGFFEWINRYRIHYAADILSTPDCQYTISQIGFEAGFFNKVTFYKAFRQYFHCTPIEYLAKLENERARMS